jgi:hypothetical protein
MIAVASSSSVLRWEGRFGRRRRNSAPPRPFAAIAALVNGPMVDHLVEIEKLVLVAVYDELLESGKLALRLAGFSGHPRPWGVAWGGREGSLFFKDLLLRPNVQARGRRLDASREDLLALALTLDRQIERHARYPWLVHARRLKLPCLWAAFRAAQAPHITGDGPELAASARQTGRSPKGLLAESKRVHEGLALYPLEWVSHEWQRAAGVFADLRTFPRWQVFPLARLPEDLQGFRGASQFDFCDSRFRRPLVPEASVATIAKDVVAV